MTAVSSSRLPWLISSMLVSVLIVVPMIVVLLSLFGSADSSWQHIRDTILLDYLTNTGLLMLQVAIYTLLIGVSCAWLTVATEFPGRKWFAWALMLPLAAPAYIVAYVYTDLLEFSGPVQTALRSLTGWGAGDYIFPQIRSLGGAAVVMSLVLYPYVYLLARVAFVRHSATLFDAARTLGASPTKAFFQIALPVARPAIAAGLALVLMETLADFGVVDYFGVPTFSTGIFRVWFALGERAAAMKLAAVMFCFVIVLVMVEKLNRRKVQQATFARDGILKRLPLNGWHAALAVIVCAVPVVLGCLLPLGVLIYLAVTTGDPLLGSEFKDGFGIFAANSVQVALIATVIAVGVALLLSYAQHIAPARSIKATVQIATLGYALPGAMLAVGLLTPVAKLDHWLADFFAQHFEWRTGLLLTGTIAILVYAYVVRFLTVAYNTTSSGLEQIPPIFDETARSLGATPSRLLKAIHLPLMRNAIISAGILVFVDTMRELPATLLLRPFNFETLATRVYRLASDERLAEASTAAIAIVLIGLIPVIFLHRLNHKNQD